MEVDSTHFALPDPSWKVAESDLPRAGILVKYRTALYQMFGYINACGRWMALDGMEESLPVKSWREITDPTSNWPERIA